MKDQPFVVTGKKAKVGDLVIRGPHWDTIHPPSRFPSYDDEGKLPGTLMKITMTKKGYTAQVRWQKLHTNVEYKIGREGVYHLSFYDKPIQDILVELNTLEKSWES